MKALCSACKMRIKMSLENVTISVNMPINVSTWLSLPWLTCDKALLYCVTKPINTFCRCVCKTYQCVFTWIKRVYKTSFSFICTLKEFVSIKPDTVHSKTLLTRFMKACLHLYRDEIKRVYLQIKRDYMECILVVILKIEQLLNKSECFGTLSKMS